MSWILTATGREHHLGACSALRPGNTPQIEEIAHALAQINRYTGHAARPYSVAEHSLLVCDIVRAAWMAFENTQAMLVREAFQIRVAHVAYRDAIKGADLVALATERRDLLPFAHEGCAPWPVLDTPGAEVPPARLSLNDKDRAAAPWTHWRDAFLARFHALDAERMQCGRAGAAATI